MTDQMLHYDQADPVILAVNARTAASNGTSCALCGRAVWRGSRIATVAVGGDHGPAHISCVARAAGRETSGAR